MITRKSETTLLAGVIGNPINHSKSPLLHNFWLKNHAIKGYYVPVNVEPKNLSKAIEAFILLGFRGVNVTLPHKTTILSLVDTVTDRASVIGAANTLYFNSAGKVTADNTDGYGFIKNLTHFSDWSPNTGPAVVFGAGGAAKAVLHSLLAEGVSTVRILNRTKIKAKMLAENFGNKVQVYDWYASDEALKGAALVVNATSLGMRNQPELKPNLSNVMSSALITDLVYNPLETKFLEIAKAQKLKTVDGLGMLIFQAEQGFTNWYGFKPEISDSLKKLLVQND